MCSAKQLVEPVRRNGGVAGRHLPPEIARRPWDHHHDFDAIGRAQRPLLDPSLCAEHAPTHVCMRASATHQAHHDPHALELIILLGVMAAAAFLGQLEHALELKLEPMVATCIGIAGRSLRRRLGALAHRSANVAARHYILGSAAIVYDLALAQAYRFGDLSHVYAIARRCSAADGDADHALGLMRASAAAHLTGGCDPADMGIVLLAARSDGPGAL